jgi:hypothetical protein
MSASSRPTLAPSAASASARFTAVVDLPTPPLPEATAMMFFTCGISFTPRCTRARRSCENTLALTLPAPGSAFSLSITRVADAVDLAFRRVAQFDVERDVAAVILMFFAQRVLRNPCRCWDR